MSVQSDLIKQAIKNGYPSCRVELKGISVVPRRKLHESGYKMMYIIGYDDKYKPYIISKCCDSINFDSIFSKIPFHSLQMDIEESGIINLWSRYNRFSVDGEQFSTVRLTVSEEVE